MMNLVSELKFGIYLEIFWVIFRCEAERDAGKQKGKLYVW